MPGPLHAYRRMAASGALERDDAQEAAARRLQKLYADIKGYRPGRGLFGRRRKPPRGVYLYGGVGRGKSLLMDLFFEAAQISAKRRVHFHEFMAEIHDWIFDWRQTPERARRKSKAYVAGAGDDPIRPAARAVARRAALLCFDEFHVNDIADAMILGRLFAALFDEGVVIVATSNFAPEDLYKDGVNRQLFEPFIELIGEKLDIVHLDSDTDYRLKRLRGAPVYYAPLGPEADAAMDRAWDALTCRAPTRREAIPVKGREVVAPRAAMGAARFEFADLFEQPLGPNDYLAIARHFHTVFIDQIPVMTPERRNEARRFITAVDAFYEHRVKLVVSAAAAPSDLYREGAGADQFARTASRLIEMQSEDYLASRHRAEASRDEASA